MAPPHRGWSRQHRIPPDLAGLYKTQSAKLLDAEGTIIEKDRQINALTETISRLHQRDGGTSRDDDYLTAQFSDITNSITAWTVNNFHKSLQKTITDLNELPAALAQMVREVVYDSTNILVSIPSRRNLVNAVVIRTIFLYLFRPFLFGAPEAGDHLNAVSPQLQGTDYQVQRWRALTVNLLAQGPSYENQYDKEISSIVVTLANFLAHLAPVESDAEARNAELHKIVGRAAALSVEIHKQADLICLSPVEPGALFESNSMEDLGYDYELHELEGKAVVQVPIFPAVIRRSCAPGGMLSEPHYVMKARVTTMFVNQD
ncbi:hypothetical protein DFP73DRAFT_523288 [Morchella snyderi]|nr:hypothetical protein DFP73DRAFT_523288 [Morchella snyderi]